MAFRRRRRRRRFGVFGVLAKMGVAVWVGRMVGRSLAFAWGPPAGRTGAPAARQPPDEGTAGGDARPGATALADEEGVRYAAPAAPEIVEVKSPAELEGRPGFRAPDAGSGVTERTLGATRADPEDWVASREDGPTDGG